MSEGQEEQPVPTCYNCGGTEMRGNRRTADGRWAHTCGAVICAICGAEPLPTESVCATCLAASPSGSAA